MDNGAHRENGKQKPPQGQWFLQHQPSMKQIMAIMAERDAAIQERNVALSEKKSALAERDMAILQRDTAISERNGAMMERERAIASLQYREDEINSGAKDFLHHHPHQHMHRHHQTHVDESPYNSREIQQQQHINDSLPLSLPEPEPSKPKRAKREKEAKPKKPAKKRAKRERDEDYEEGSNSKSCWKDQNLGLNQVAYDDSTMPVPVCSCTGVYRPCYKWGSGGWQSSCCTTTMSQYPLPQVPNKRHARIGGRKMSGSAFNKLLSRLAAEGHDLANPVDLKNNWAKHGTNRYITIK